MSAQQALAAVTNQVGGQAYLLATIDIFRISAILMVLLVPMIWVTSQAKAEGGPPGAAD
jgi:DHA2 family multidrug resistance protein